MALERDFHICQDCLRAKSRGEMTRPRTATVVHHIQPVELRPDLRLDLENLVSLCDACHNKRHPEKGGSAFKKSDTINTKGVRVIKV